MRILSKGGLILEGSVGLGGQGGESAGIRPRKREEYLKGENV